MSAEKNVVKEEMFNADFANTVSNIEDAKTFIKVLLDSNATLVALATNLVARLLPDESGVMKHDHGPECPVSIVISIMERSGMCYALPTGGWQLRRSDEKLN